MTKRKVHIEIEIDDEKVGSLQDLEKEILSKDIWKGEPLETFMTLRATNGNENHCIVVLTGASDFHTKSFSCYC